MCIGAAILPNESRAVFGGGSIVASRWVLTAAHCVDENTKPTQIAILTGTASLSGGGQRVSVAPKGIVVHERWDKISHNFDIAIIHVISDLNGKAIRGVDPDEKEIQEGQLITVTGWGALSWHHSSGTNDLQVMSVPYVSRTVCNAPASYNRRITENMFCAGKKEGGSDACQGD